MAGVRKQKALEMAEELARRAGHAGDAYEELLAEGARHKDNHDCRRAAMSYREAIALRPNKPEAYLSLGGVLADSGHQVEARNASSKPRSSCRRARRLGSGHDISFRIAAAQANSETPRPEWWNDTGLKALSARVVRAAPNRQPPTTCGRWC